MFLELFCVFGSFFLGEVRWGREEVVFVLVGGSYGLFGGGLVIE